MGGPKAIPLRWRWYFFSEPETHHSGVCRGETGRYSAIPDQVEGRISGGFGGPTLPDSTRFDLARVIKARAAVDEGTTKLIPNTGQLTLINTYSVQPERAEELIEFLMRATQETVRYVPGFISANLHLSFDRTKIVNYAQWVDAEATAAARQDPMVAELMRQQLQIADSFNPLPFNLRSSVSAAPTK